MLSTSIARDRTDDRRRRNYQWRLREPVRDAGLRLACALLFLAANTGCTDSISPSPTRVAFSVDMRQPVEDGWFDPNLETVGVRGDAPPLSWNESIAATDEDHDYLYEVVVELDSLPGNPIVFKFKVDGEGNPNDGWQAGSNRWIDLTDSHRYQASFEDEARDRPTTFVGTIKQHTEFEVFGSNLKKRTLYVYLPPGYSESTDRYPVLYMHDGRNVFDASEIGAEWEMDEAANRLIESGAINPLIIVGVGNTSDRMTEYTPPQPTDLDSGGGGDVYGTYLVDGVKPFIDAIYRTRPDRANTALGGSSLGGLISLYLGLKNPDVFAQLLIVSPSVWWDDQEILEDVKALEGSTNQRIWLYVGGREGKGMVSGARELRNLLLQRGWTNETLRYSEDPAGTHSERSWANRSEEMLRFLSAGSDDAHEKKHED